MVADEGVVAGAVAVEPGGRALVQVGAVGLRQARVGGVAEEDVVEGVAVVARVGSCGGVDEAGAREREQVAGDLAGEGGDGAERELASDDCSSLQHSPFRRGEAAEAACEHGFERGRQPFAAFGRERRELLGVERVALGELDDPLARLVVELRGAGDDRARLVVAERAERERARRAAARAPAGRGRARAAGRRRGRPGSRSGRASAGSAQWTSSSTSRTGCVRGERLEQAADGPVRLPERRRLRALGERA